MQITVRRDLQVAQVAARGKPCAGMKGLIEERPGNDEGASRRFPTLDASLIASAPKVEHYEIASYVRSQPLRRFSACRTRKICSGRRSTKKRKPTRSSRRRPAKSTSRPRPMGRTEEAAMAAARSSRGGSSSGSARKSNAPARRNASQGRVVIVDRSDRVGAWELPTTLRTPRTRAITPRYAHITLLLPSTRWRVAFIPAFSAPPSAAQAPPPPAPPPIVSPKCPGPSHYIPSMRRRRKRFASAARHPLVLGQTGVMTRGENGVWTFHLCARFRPGPTGTT